MLNIIAFNRRTNKKDCFRRQGAIIRYFSFSTAQYSKYFGRCLPTSLTCHLLPDEMIYLAKVVFFRRSIVNSTLLFGSITAC